MSFSAFTHSQGDQAPWLLADIGGTKTRFSLCPPGGTPAQQEVLYNKEHASLAAAARSYLAAKQPAQQPRAAALCIAGPTEGEEVGLTNFGWSFRKDDWREEMGLERLEVTNDFTAVALAVPHLKDDDVAQLGDGTAKPGGVIGVIGPGTGLGVSGLVPIDGHWTALKSEGGHSSLPAATEREAAVVAHLRTRFSGHVSSERAISGPGLVNLYGALCAVDGTTAKDLEPRQIAAHAAAKTDPHCGEACAMFSAMLGTVASNLALVLGAHGGIYIAGGVVHNMGAAFDAAGFRARFESKGRLSDFVAPIPTYHITRRWPAFVGLAAVLATTPNA